MNRLMSLHAFRTGYTHMQHDSGQQTTSMHKNMQAKSYESRIAQKYGLIDHCTIRMREYNPVCNRIY
jgi:hypothetical protein